MTVEAWSIAVVAPTTTWSEFGNLGAAVGPGLRVRSCPPELATGDGEELWQNVMLYTD